MIHLDLDKLFNSKKHQQEQEILKKVKEQGVDSLTKEEKVIYELIKTKPLLM